MGHRRRCTDIMNYESKYLMLCTHRSRHIKFDDGSNH